MLMSFLIDADAPFVEGVGFESPALEKSRGWEGGGEGAVCGKKRVMVVPTRRAKPEERIKGPCRTAYDVILGSSHPLAEPAGSCDSLRSTPPARHRAGPGKESWIKQTGGWRTITKR
ncbi:hypothetical protein AAFF_G00056960 [Aldrovandia affinis]|uniref:Uncharacterized protein n=1 Tax=Aldrovandia affinis TaxID=143900 RepID=A0AAD7S0J1_9TELE|nr:hypothetical protein AAFF_G00056960 [Aldrovandia affinis]